MHHFLRSTTFVILFASILFSLVITSYVLVTVSSEGLQIIRLTQAYGLTAFTLLYSTLLITPLCSVFAKTRLFSTAQPALGIATLYFAMLHSSIAFFGQLGGFAGLPFLSNDYILAISASATAETILIIFIALAYDRLTGWLSPAIRKAFQHLLYFAGILILLHILLLGTHFQDLTSIASRLVYIGLAIFILLEAIRIDRWLKHTFKIPQYAGFATVFLGSAVIASGIYLFTPLLQQEKLSVSTHKKHPQQDSGVTAIAAHPGMQGDTSLRFTVGFDRPEQMQPNQNITLSFDVFNAANGSASTLFQKFYEKEAHLIIVDNDLQYFNHIHPQRVGNTFTVTTQFPKAGSYRAYLTYQPVGAVEQQVAFSFPVGVGSVTPGVTHRTQDQTLLKTFGNYTSALAINDGLTAAAMQSGKETLSFFIRNAQSNEPVTTLKPYLGAFGHLVMIHTKDYSYIHVHPVGPEPKPDQSSGPEVQFQPMPLTDTVKPGVYRLFAEFNPEGNRFVADYTVEVK